MKLEKRQPTGVRFRDRSGEVTPHGLTILRFAGFHNQFSVWTCSCPKCGNEFDIIQTGLGAQKSCGKRCPGTIGKARQSKSLYNRWYALKQSGRLADAWQDWNAIVDAIGSLEGKSLLPIDPDKPVGPDNFQIKTLGDVGIDVAEYRGKPVTVKAAAKLLGISRQRAAQLLDAGELQTRLNRLPKG